MLGRIEPGLYREVYFRPGVMFQNQRKGGEGGTLFGHGSVITSYCFGFKGAFLSTRWSRSCSTWLWAVRPKEFS